VPLKAFTICYYQNDQIGTPRELTDEHGTIKWAATYKTWGIVETEFIDDDVEETFLDGNTIKRVAKQNTKPMAQASAASRDDVYQPLRFQGQYFDEETGLHYNRFRYYDPDVGRFVSQDPIGLQGGDNLYEYAPSPLGWIDPFGLAPCAASLLGRLKGGSIRRIEKELSKAGFTRLKDNGKNATWQHPDGSEVRIHRYGNEKPSGYKSGNNAHVHKLDPCKNQLDDRGLIATDGDAKHIGVNPPKDLPTVRGRTHGDGS
jgi:RHS repeat-associated protein